MSSATTCQKNTPNNNSLSIPSPPPIQSLRRSDSSSTAAASPGSRSSASKRSKKKKFQSGSSKYHIFPMIGNSRTYGADDCDSSDSEITDYSTGRQIMNSNNNSMEERGSIYNNGMMSDQDVLRDIFTVSSGGASLDVVPSEKQHRIQSNEIDPFFADTQRATFGSRRSSSSDSSSETQQVSNAIAQQQQQQQATPPPPVDQPFTSRLGQRIWKEYCNESQAISPQRHSQQHNSSSSTQPILSFHQLPTSNFLRLPPSIICIQQQQNSGNFTSVLSSLKKETTIKQWVNIEELERKVMQHHLNLEAMQQLNGNSSSAHSSDSPLMKDEADARHDKWRVDNTNSLRNDNSISNMRNLSSASSLITSECFTKVIHRDPNVGLGMTLREYNGCVYIQALLRMDGSKIELRRHDSDMISFREPNNGGPGSRAGLLPGDRILGLNGQPFLQGRLATDTDDIDLKITGSFKVQSKQIPTSEEILKSVGDVVSCACSPMAVHIQRVDEDEREQILICLHKAQRESMMMKKKQSSKANTNHIGLQTPKKVVTPTKKGPYIHPFAKSLSDRSIIKKGTEEITVTRQLRIFTDRTRQWESKLSFRLRASDYTLRPLLDARDVEPSYYASFLSHDGEMPAFFDYKGSKNIRGYAPSTPMIQDWRLNINGGNMVSSPARRVSQRISKEAAIMADLYAGLDEDDAYVQDLILGGSGKSSMTNGVGGAAYPTHQRIMKAMSDPTDIFVPLVGVRKAICVRILNTFLDSKNRTAFTIWCYDVETGMEWYAPVRYYNDFKDLRTALTTVDKTIGDRVPFPTMGGWGLLSSSEANESAKVKEARRSQLEIFLRRVFAGVYRGRLHPYLAEIAVHLQTFVGCDTVLDDGDFFRLSLSKQVAISEVTYGKREPTNSKAESDDNAARLHLKRSIMRYVYRLFLLPTLGELVGHFIDAAKEKVMSLSLSPNTSKTHQFSVDKKEATKDVEKIRDFIDHLQDLILEGCRDDFISISQRRDFAAFVDDPDNIARDDLFREAVREQCELEIYVPLRSTISKYLVYSWFNEDMEMKHKMKVSILCRC